MKKRNILMKTLFLLLILISFSLIIKKIKAQDIMPPATITDLKAYRTYIPSSDKLILEWTAPGDDGKIGTTAAYDIRYYTSPINENNWNLAFKVNVDIIPSPAGSKESVVIRNLTNNTMYYFAIKSRDESNNWSNLSNIANRNTLPAVTARSGSPQDIQNAVNTIAALGGGVVYIPAGDFVFNPPTGGVGVTIPPGISIIGAGKDKTILRETVESKGSTMMSIDGTLVSWNEPQKPVSIQGISFIGFVPNREDADSTTNNQGLGIGSIKDYLIYNCSFSNFVNIGIISDNNMGWEISPYMHRGVISHCDFDQPYKDNTNISDRIWGYGIIPSGTGHWFNQSLESLLGNYDAPMPYGGITYIEDSTFRRCRHAIAGGSEGGGFYVVRHSFFTEMIQFHYGSYIDAHGGTVGVEVYDNHILNSPVDYRTSLIPPENYIGKYLGLAIGIRGGGGVIYNNTIEKFDEGTGIQLYNDFGPEDSRYEEMKVKNMWIWNNTFINVSKELVWWEHKGTYLNRDFFLEPKLCYQPYPYPHPLTLDIPENFNFTVEPIKLTISGRLLDKNNSPVTANITIYKNLTSYSVISTNTDSQGNYNLSVGCGVYDVQFTPLNFSIENFSIKLFSLNQFSKLSNPISYINSTKNNVVFAVDIVGTKLIQVYSSSKPLVIKKDGKNLEEVLSLFELRNNTWFYNQTDKNLHILVSDT